jgi:transcriptional regulator
MYLPAAFSTGHGDAVALIDQHPLAQLVVVVEGAPAATPVPMIVRGDSLVGHLARPNGIWHHEGAALAIFTGADAYISPRWYENKPVDGKVVPTWNYTTVQVSGRLVAHDDPEWKRQLVGDLTERFESALDSPWSVGDAPDAYIETMLRGIVGIELTDLQVVGKSKMSQNRPVADQRQVAAGLDARSPGEQAVARAMWQLVAPTND